MNYSTDFKSIRNDVSAQEWQARTDLAACYAHASQTPDRYYALQDQVAAFRGIEGGYKRSEAFILQLQSPQDPLQELGLTTRKAG